jgi:transposase
MAVETAYPTPLHKLPVDPTCDFTPRRPWQPLSEAEWNELGGFLCIHNCGMSFDRSARRRGRPMEDVRARLDAIFRAVTLKHPHGGRGSWTQLPEGFGKPDTVSRTFRRWHKQGLWERLLREVAHPDCSELLRSLAYFICCAYRRAYRMMGLRGVLLGKRLGLLSAMPSLPWKMPDPILSGEVFAATTKVMEAHDRWHEPWWRPMARALIKLNGDLASRKYQRIHEPA